MADQVTDAKKLIKGKFRPSTNAEAKFYKQLKKVAKESSKIVKRHVKGASIHDPVVLQRELDAYAEKLKSSGWAAKQSAEMLKTIANSNYRAYSKNSNEMAKLMKTDLAASEVGDISVALLHEQVGLITSIPIEAGLRAQQIAVENFLQGNRAVPDQSIIDELVNQMGMTEEVAVNRAKLIARTETARANSAFVQGRATAIGSTSYIWRTTMDGAERHSHAEMNGKRVFWNKPPTLSDGMTGHAGSFPNCRCYPDPVLPDLD